jgi:hypothetical protein
VRPERCIISVSIDPCAHRLVKALASGETARVCQRARKCLVDYPFRGERASEHDRGDLANLFALGSGASNRHHSRGRANAGDVLLALCADTPDEHSNIRALAAPVGMEFVEYEEAKILVDRISDWSLLDPRQQELEHHVVGQQDMGRVFPHALSRLLPFLTRVLTEGDRETPARAFLVVFLIGLELDGLRIDQGVHRVDDNRRHALRLRFGEKAVED